MPDNNRTDTIVLILFAVVALVVPAAVIMCHFFGIDPLVLLHISWGRTVVGVIFALLGTAVTALNVFLTIIAPWNHKRRYGGMQAHSSMSGLPVIGGIFIFCAGALLPSSITLGIFLLTLYGLDTGGLPWILYAILTKDR